MTERKRDHLATISLALIIALIAVTHYAPSVIFFSVIILAMVSLPIVLWNALRSVL